MQNFYIGCQQSIKEAKYLFEYDPYITFFASPKLFNIEAIIISIYLHLIIAITVDTDITMSITQFDIAQ